MNNSKAIVLDANILIRAVLGKRVLDLLIKYQNGVHFYCPEMCFEEAKKHIPKIFSTRKMDSKVALKKMDKLSCMVQKVSHVDYKTNERVSRQRIKLRDLSDWPVVATALTLDCPIWTEDNDFFGSGIATWTTDRVELYFRS